MSISFATCDERHRRSYVISFDFYPVMIACGGVRVVSVELCCLSVSVSFSSVYFAYLYMLTVIRLGVRGCISASKFLILSV